MSHRLVLILGAGAVGIVAVWFFVLPRRPSPRLFSGEAHVTNEFAYFTLTNRHRHPVKFYFTAQVMTDTGWPLSIATSGRAFSQLLPATVVPVAQTSMVRVVVPVEAGRWRLRVLYCETETLRDRFIYWSAGAMNEVGLGTLATKIAINKPWYDIFGREMSR
jgi:hypothetical protein